MRVEPLIKGYQSVAINLLAALGMWFFRKYFINSNWRKMIVYVTFLEVVLRAVTELLALFGILRHGDLSFVTIKMLDKRPYLTIFCFFFQLNNVNGTTRLYFFIVDWKDFSHYKISRIFLLTSSKMTNHTKVVFRNQYFWYADDLVYGFFYNWIFFTSSLIVIEYAPKNLEGTSFAVLWAVASCSGAIGE